ncbi:MAG: hypothetical protein RBR71_08450 [Gudongella sp.]|nr:hypothetical protein [Gudongella sp.]
MKVLFIKSGLSNKEKYFLPIRYKEPIELLYLANQIQPFIKDKVQLDFIDMELENASYKKQLLDIDPDLVVFFAEKEQGDIISKQASLTKEITPRSYTALLGELTDNFKSPYIDFLYKDNAVESFNETLIGIQVDRSIEEIKRNVESVDELLSKPLNKPLRSLSSEYSKDYYFLQHPSVIEIHSIERIDFNEDIILGKTEGILRKEEEITEDIKNNPNNGIFLKDLDIWADKDRLKKLLNILEEKSLNRTYISHGNWNTVLEEEALLERFSKLGLKAMIMNLGFPQDEDNWILKQEVMRMLRKHGVEPVLIVSEVLSKEDEEALIFWLKTNKEGLVILTEEAFAENASIYKELSLSVPIIFGWTKQYGLGEALRRQKEYKAIYNSQITNHN